MDKNLITVGRILKPLGLRGEVVVEPLTYDPDRFNSLAEIAIETKEGLHWRGIQSVYKKGSKLIVKFFGLDTPEELLPYRGAYLKIDSSQSPPLPEATYYYYQLEGLSVFDDKGNYLGVLTSIMQAGAADVYTITDSDGREILLPAIKDVILSIDLKNKKVIVRLIEMV